MTRLPIATALALCMAASRSTGLPPELRCRLDLIPPHISEDMLEAGGSISCEEPAERIEVELKVVGDYTDGNGLPQRTATYGDDDAGGNTDLVDVAINSVRCKENDPTSVLYNYKIMGEATNVGGWVQKFSFETRTPAPAFRPEILSRR